VLRFNKARSPVLLQLGWAALMHVVSAIGGVVAYGALAYWPFAAAYVFLFAVHLVAFGALYKSVSLVMLCHMAERPGHSATIGELVQNVVEPTFAERADILVSAGLVATADGAYAITSTGAAMAARLSAVQNLFAIARPGLYRRPDQR
jgi:hypothetical protein